MTSGVTFIEAAYSERFTRLFGWWSRDKMLGRKFHALRVAQEQDGTLGAVADHPGPVVCVTNHTSWWDPIVMLVLHRQVLAGRTLRAPMDAAQLRRFRFFRRLGTFGIEPDEPRSLDAMVEYLARYFTEDTRPTLWITPQGRFADVREPVRTRPGAAAICATHGDTRCVAINLEYAFWLDAKPEILVRYQRVEPEKTSTSGWHRAIQGALEDNGARLARLVMARDPRAFEPLVDGASSHGNPLYTLWLRARGQGHLLDDRRDRAHARSERRAGGAA